MNINIVTVGDIHARVGDSIARLTKIKNYINGSSANLVAFLGDLSDTGNVAEFQAVKAVTDKITKTKIFIKGNHDAVNDIDFNKYFGSSNRIVTINGFQIILIDISVSSPCTTSAPCWKAPFASADITLPTIVFMHGLPYKLPSVAKGGCTMGPLFGYALLRPSNIQKQLAKFTNLIAVFAGHMHMDYSHTLNMREDSALIQKIGLCEGTKFIINGALIARYVGCPNAGYATNYIGYSSVTDNNISYKQIYYTGCGVH